MAAALRARRGRRVYTLWPDARRPMICADVGYPPAAEWLRRTMVPTLRRLPDAATWMSLRAGAALVAEDEGLASRVALEHVGLESPPRVAMYSPSGQAVSKTICFLFPEGDERPGLVVKAMAEPRFDWRLREESAVLESIRQRVENLQVASGLPPSPLFGGDVAGEFVLAEPFDELAARTGSGTREATLSWLRDFHAASAASDRPWSAADEEASLQSVRDGWGLAKKDSGQFVVERARALLEPLRGASVPRCAVHGDFWRGNIAADGGLIRVYDWEWARPEGDPLFDLWTYELADLRLLVREGRRPLDPELAAALDRVETELRRRGLDERLARGSLPAVLAHISFRIRTRLDMPDEMESHSIVVMEAAERLLLSA